MSWGKCHRGRCRGKCCAIGEISGENVREKCHKEKYHRGSAIGEVSKGKCRAIGESVIGERAVP